MFRKPLFLIVFSWLISACSTQRNDPFLDNLTAKPNAELLTSSEWIIVSGHSFNENDVKRDLDELLPLDGTRAKVNFSPSGLLSIRGACSTFSGTWILRDNVVQVSALSPSGEKCTAERAKLDSTVNTLFSKKTILVRVPNGLDDSLLRMQSGNFYFVMEAAAKVDKNNKSYSGRYYTEDFFSHYNWSLVKATNGKGARLFSPSPFTSTILYQKDGTLVVKAACGETSFSLEQNKNEITLHAIPSTGASCAEFRDNLSGKHFHIVGQMLGRHPEIQLISEDGTILKLKGNKR